MPEIMNKRLQTPLFATTIFPEIKLLPSPNTAPWVPPASARGWRTSQRELASDIDCMMG